MRQRNVGIVVGMLLAVFLTSGDAAALVVVSDIDDTVKITNVGSCFAAVENTFVGARAFAGMAVLYRGLLGRESTPDNLNFVTGGPWFLGAIDDRFLTTNEFPVHRTSLRSVTELFEDVDRYKTAVLYDTYATAHEKFILIGDDTESDPEVYAGFRVQHPDGVLAVYVHMITGRDVPEGSTRFLTASDIAVHEYLAGRLSEEQALQVARAVRDADDFMFLPRFQHCPASLEGIPGLPASLADLTGEIDARVTAMCTARG